MKEKKIYDYINIRKQKELQDLKIQGKLFIGFKYLANMINNCNINYNCIRKGYKLEIRLTLQILAHLKAK
jgi:hypothetical protein